MKKFLSSLLITVLIFSNTAVLTLPTHRAQAFLGFGDISFDPPNTLLTAKDLAIEIGKAALKRLANKVLNKMLKKTVNWAITGFGPYEESAGQPFYVQNQDSLIKNIEDQALVQTIDAIGDGCKENECPYAKDLARSLVKSHISGNKNETPVFNLDKYSSNWKAFTEEGKFSEGGGWKTWEGMFNNPQNSAFGSFLMTTVKNEEKKETVVAKQEKELTRNDGFLSMRKCVAYKDGKAPTSEIDFSKFSNTFKGDDKNPPTTIINTDGQPIASSEDELGQGGGITLGGDDQNNSSNPPTQTAPQGTTEEAYSNTKAYKAGAIVSYSGNTFEAKLDVTGKAPPVGQYSNNSWKFLKTAGGVFSGNGIDTSGFGVSNFQDTYALPGLEVDNCIRYEVTTPGAMAKEMLGKTLTSTIDKATLDSSTGNSIIDSLVDMAAIFITNGLDKLITKATTKTGDQQIYAGGIGDINATYLGVGSGSSSNSAYYSADGKTPIEIQDPYDPKKLHPDLVRGMELTKQEIAELEILLANLRSQPELYKHLDMCLPGPDLNWEKRLNDEFKKSATRLERKAGKDNNRGDKAQEAIGRLESYKEAQISQTKLSMLSVIPSSISILAKMTQVQQLSSGLTSNEKKYSQRVGALATLEAIEKSLAAGELDTASILTLKKQYSGISRDISTEETLEDTISDKEAAEADVDINFNRDNPKSLISKCIEERKALPLDTIREDMGDTLFCNWQTHDIESYRTVSDGEKWLMNNTGIVGLGVKLFEGDDVKMATSEYILSPYDKSRGLILPLIGNKYTQNEYPFEPRKADGKVDRSAEFSVDCNKYYVAPISYYLDQK